MTTTRPEVFPGHLDGVLGVLETAEVGAPVLEWRQTNVPSGGLGRGATVIRLRNEEITVAKAPEKVPSRRAQVMRDLLGMFPRGRLVDLGTGHGHFAILAADLGWEVTAVDARKERWPDDDRVEWVQKDVRDVEFADFDLILCLGLFYHLTNRDQLTLIERAAGRPMILDTHLDHGVHEHSVSERVRSAEGFEGCWYMEPNALTSSWRNPASFWPTLSSFHEMLALHGFRTVLAVDPWITSDRTFFVAIPARASRPATRPGGSVRGRLSHRLGRGSRQPS